VEGGKNERRNERTKDSRKDRKSDGEKGIKKESELETREKGQGLKGRHNGKKRRRKIGRIKYKEQHEDRCSCVHYQFGCCIFHRRTNEEQSTRPWETTAS
jgi:hypothetical protein